MTGNFTWWKKDQFVAGAKTCSCHSCYVLIGTRRVVSAKYFPPPQRKFGLFSLLGSFARVCFGLAGRVVRTGLDAISERTHPWIALRARKRFQMFHPFVFTVASY